ncbi:MAG: preprotein translocase subunit SecE [Deltaproteobacteria bacterium]|jgi:preprotein translocase subunit SecE|nr:preprotein translocase subunit SecE [Deltaproteobacteria bacterium]
MAVKDTKQNAELAQPEKAAAPKAAPKKAVKASQEKKSSSEPGKVEQAKVFFEESRAELKKVTWPTKKEIRVTTIAVLILVTLMSIFLGVLDLGLVKIVGAITGMGS